MNNKDLIMLKFATADNKNYPIGTTCKIFTKNKIGIFILLIDSSFKFSYLLISKKSLIDVDVAHIEFTEIIKMVDFLGIKKIWLGFFGRIPITTYYVKNHSISIKLKDLTFCN